MSEVPSPPASSTGTRHRPLTRVALAALVLAACGEGATGPVPDSPGTDPATIATIASMRLLFGADPTRAATVTISRSGTITGDPVVVIRPGLPYFEEDDAIALEAAFLDVGGAVVRPLPGLELVVTPTNPTVLKYSRRDDFRGTLELLRAGDTQIRLELIRSVDKKTLFGPVTLPVTVRS
jgi:hypothetical protein